VNIDELIDKWEAAWSGRDPAAFDESCLPGVHYEDPVTSEPLEGIDELRRHAHRLWAAFPDARLEATGDRLTNGHFLAAPSNKFVIVHCVFYCELAGEKLYRIRALFDLYDAAVQLGVLPARGTLGERALLMLRGFGLRAGRS